MASTKMHTYAITSPSEPVVVRARDILRHYLPVSLPLYRRLQFGRFFEATTLVSNLYSLNPNVALHLPDRDQWLIAFVDRTCRPETEVWMFATWEANSSTTTGEGGAQRDLQNRLIRQLLRTLKSLPIPTSLHQDILDAAQLQATSNGTNDDNDVDFSGTSRSEYAAHMLDTDIMLLGAIHESTARILERNGLIANISKTGLVPNHLYTFKVDALPSKATTTLPSDLHWGTLTQPHFPLVRSRTQIPRQDRTLAVLPNVAIFSRGARGEAEATPIAWAFIGLDGSLSTLHVEPEYRGRGLAKAVMAKLFREKMDMLWEEGVERMAHDYVIKGNEASVGVGKSMGGRCGWEVFWCRVDLRAGGG